MNRAMISLRMFAVLAVSMLTLTLGAGEALAQEKLSAKVLRPMKAAQDSMKKKQWDQALAKLSEADAAAGKTAYDQFQINEFKGYVYHEQKKYAEEARVFEANLNSSKVPSTEVESRLQNLIKLYAATRNNPKIVELGDRWVKAGGRDPVTRAIVAQGHFVQKDYKGSIPHMQAAIKGIEQGGKSADENWYQLLRSAQLQMGDLGGSAQTLEKLIRVYPKAEYWDELLDSRLRQNNTDGVQVNLLRLSRQVGGMDADSYVELTEMLLEAGLPGEAKSVMEAGYQAKVFEGADKTRADRYARRLNDARAAATKDQQSLATIEKDAQKSPTGQGSVALGMAYWSFGQYDKAVTALTQGLQKGGVRNPDEANMILGMANLKLGKKAEAAKAFDQVKADPKMADVARLWTLVANSAA